MCDIGIVAIDGTVLLDQLVKPSAPIPTEATAIHGISNEMVADAATWAAIADRVAGIIDGRLTVIYNRGYDREILINEMKRCARTLEIHSDCAMLAFADYKATPGKYPGQFRWHRLDVAAAEFGIPPGGHRALADAETTRRVVLAMAADTSCDETVRALDWLDAVNKQIDRVVDAIPDSQLPLIGR